MTSGLDFRFLASGFQRKVGDSFNGRGERKCRNNEFASEQRQKIPSLTNIEESLSLLFSKTGCELRPVSRWGGARRPAEDGMAS